VQGARRKVQGTRQQRLSFLAPCLPCGIPALRDPPEAGFHKVSLEPYASLATDYWLLATGRQKAENRFRISDCEMRIGKNKERRAPQS
jgi:hypothetical protein